MAEAATSFPAFKEWAPIVGALARGEQILLLRKGGIAEGRGGFQVRHSRFWLFPTVFHAGPEKLKTDLPPGPSLDPEGRIPLQWVADVIEHRFVAAWSDVVALDALHGWSEAAVREKFAWSHPAGLHVFVVRVSGLPSPLWLEPSDDWGGCKSWLTLPLVPEEQLLTPVLSDALFREKQAAWRR